MYTHATDAGWISRSHRAISPFRLVRPGTPEEAVDRVVALKMFTVSNSQSMLAEDYIGSLEPGKFADFAVLLNNWLEGPDSELGINKVIMTVVGDEVIYEDANAPWKAEATTAAR